MTRAEILEARRQLTNLRMAYIGKLQGKYDNALNDYDEQYYASLRELQAECGKTGHTRTVDMRIRCSICDKFLRSDE